MVNLVAAIVEWLLLFVQIQSVITVTVRSASACQGLVMPAVGTQHTFVSPTMDTRQKKKVIKILLTTIYYSSN